MEAYPGALGKGRAGSLTDGLGSERRKRRAAKLELEHATLMRDGAEHTKTPVSKWRTILREARPYERARKAAILAGHTSMGTGVR